MNQEIHKLISSALALPENRGAANGDIANQVYNTALGKSYTINSLRNYVGQVKRQLAEVVNTPSPYSQLTPVDGAIKEIGNTKLKGTKFLSRNNTPPIVDVLSTEVIIIPSGDFFNYKSTLIDISSQGNQNDTVILYICREENICVYKGKRSGFAYALNNADSRLRTPASRNRWSDALFAAMGDAMSINNPYTNIVVVSTCDDTYSSVTADEVLEYVRLCTDNLKWNFSAVTNQPQIFRRIGFETSNITPFLSTYISSRQKYIDAAKKNLPVVNFTFGRFQ